MIMGILRFIDFIVDLYILIIFVRVILSWIPHNPYHSVIRLIYQLTEPPLKWIRQWLPSFGGIDLSPIVLVVGIIILERIIFSIFI